MCARLYVHVRNFAFQENVELFHFPPLFLLDRTHVQTKRWHTQGSSRDKLELLEESADFRIFVEPRYELFERNRAALVLVDFNENLTHNVVD